MRKADWYRHGALTGLMLVDWRQTVEITKKPDRFYEAGPARLFIGKHPSEREVNIYFLSAYAFKTGTSYLLPYKWRELFQYVMIGGSGLCVGNNFAIGLGGEW